MRCLERNKQSFYYALYSGKTQQTDTDGAYTGAYTLSYASPVNIKAYVSGMNQQATETEIGIQNQAQRTIIIDDLTCPIALDSILWIDATPDAQGESGAVKHDYCVVNVNKSLNYISIIAREIV